MLNIEDIKTRYLSIKRKTRIFLLSKKSREILVFSFFFLVAASFWLIQTLNKEYESEFSVPLELTDVPDNVLLTLEPPAKVKVLLKDKGTVLMNYKLSHDFRSIKVPFTMSADKFRSTISSSFVRKKVSSQLFSSTKFLSFTPDTLDYIYSTGDSKKVPVAFYGNLSAERQYFFTDTVFSPDSVMIYAPKKILESIDTVYTEWITKKNVLDSLDLEVKLPDLRGVKIVPNTVNLNVPVDIYTDKTLEVPIRGLNFPDSLVLRTFPSNASVTFQVGVHQFNTISPDDFSFDIIYDSEKLSSTDKLSLSLKQQPKNIYNVRISPAVVDFLIEKK